jgi:hypothetical protein
LAGRSILPRSRPGRGRAVEGADDCGRPEPGAAYAGTPGADDGGSNRGAAWIVFLDANGSVVTQRKISDTQGGFDGDLDAFQVELGTAVAGLGDLDGDGIEDVAIGARGFGDNATKVDAGAVWMLFLDMSPCGVVPRAQCLVASHTAVRLARRPNPDGAVLAWRWRGSATPDLGDPTARTDYMFCVWDHTGGVPRLAAQAKVPAGRHWRPTSGGALGYRDPQGSADGVTKMKLGVGTPAVATLAARGVRAPIPEPFGPDRFFAQDPRVTMQLLNTAGTCRTSDFTRARRNTGGRYDAAAP